MAELPPLTEQPPWATIREHLRTRGITAFSGTEFTLPPGDCCCPPDLAICRCACMTGKAYAQYGLVASGFGQGGVGCDPSAANGTFTLSLLRNACTTAGGQSYCVWADDRDNPTWVLTRLAIGGLCCSGDWTASTLCSLFYGGCDARSDCDPGDGSYQALGDPQRETACSDPCGNQDGLDPAVLDLKLRPFLTGGLTAPSTIKLQGVAGSEIECGWCGCESWSATELTVELTDGTDTIEVTVEPCGNTACGTCLSSGEYRSEPVEIPWSTVPRPARVRIACDCAGDATILIDHGSGDIFTGSVTLSSCDPPYFSGSVEVSGTTLTAVVA